MKVALIGYGKMGREIHQVLDDRNHQLVAAFGKDGIDVSKLSEADVAIEFTNPESVFQNLVTCFGAKIPVVSGTTGWLSQYHEALTICKKEEGAFLYASNFSIGVNIFFEINKRLAELMNPQTNYDVSLAEIHHTEKRDAPSGTAITLAEQISKLVERKTDWTLDKISENQIQIIAQRIENVKGTHIVSYDSEIDSIAIQHEAHSRKGFALGAVLAAEFLVGKQGVFSMKDVLKF